VQDHLQLAVVLVLRRVVARQVEMFSNEEKLNRQDTKGAKVKTKQAN
jgi:hypothetical protein